MNSNQLTLIQNGEFILCDEIVYIPGIRPALTATASMPINTMKSAAVRLNNEMIPLPFISSQERKVVSAKIRIEGYLAERIATSLEISENCSPLNP